MVYKTLTKAILIAGFTIGVSSGALAADDKLMMGASTDMLMGPCAACHGDGGASGGPAIPSIGGLSPDYFIEVMEGFANGEVYSTIMGRMAKGYSEDEIKQMAEYFSSKPFVKAKQGFDEKLVDKGAKLHDKFCEKCHAEGGQSAEDDAGVMAGQWTPYVAWALEDFQAGHREMPKKMKKQMKKLLSREGDAAIQALLSFYASQQK